MAFWSKQATARREPEPAPVEFAPEFDQRFGMRYQEAKELAAEMEEVNPYQLDWEGLDVLETHAKRVIEIDREFTLDLQNEVRKNRRLMEAHPTVASMFKKLVVQAKKSLNQVRSHRRRLRREGVRRDVLAVEP